MYTYCCNLMAVIEVKYMHVVINADISKTQLLYLCKRISRNALLRTTHFKLPGVRVYKCCVCTKSLYLLCVLCFSGEGSYKRLDPWKKKL